MNHLARAVLGWKTPIQVLTGRTPDISKFLHFSFYEPMYYHLYSNSFPSSSNEEQCWCVGKDLIGRTFLMHSEEDGLLFRARVVCAVVDKEDE
jgi:hypothetical protein